MTDSGDKGSTADILRGAARRILLVGHRSNEEEAIILRSVAADLMRLAASQEVKEIANEIVDLAPKK